MTPKEALNILDETVIGNLELKIVLSNAIEKQIPKKCKKFKDVCSCGYGVFPHMNFCSQCGQALDWSDTE